MSAAAIVQGQGANMLICWQRFIGRPRNYPTQSMRGCDGAPIALDATSRSTNGYTG